MLGREKKQKSTQNIHVQDVLAKVVADLDITAVPDLYLSPHVFLIVPQQVVDAHNKGNEQDQKEDREPQNILKQNASEL